MQSRALNPHWLILTVTTQKPCDRRSVTKRRGTRKQSFSRCTETTNSLLLVLLLPHNPELLCTDQISP